MEVVKRILVGILILAGILLGAVIICTGVLVIFPSARIFGYSYLNNTADPYSEAFLEKDNALFSQSNGEFNIVIDSGNFNVQVVVMEQNNMIDVKLKNNVIGFTNALDSNKLATTTQSYDETSKTFTISVNEPTGLFLKRDTLLTIAVPKSFMQNNKINVSTTTNGGVASFGDDTANKLKLNNLTCVCEATNGTISFGNYDITGSMTLKNILGKVTVENEITGTVIIDSKIGNYNFKKVNNLIVKASSVENQENAPFVTVNEANNIEYYAEGGSITVENYVFDNLLVQSKSASVNANTIVKDVYIKGENTNIKIENIGNFVEDPNSIYNSWNYTLDDNGNKSNINSIKKLETTKGAITIGKSYYSLELKTTNGQVTVNNAYKKVMVQTENGSVNVTFNDGKLLGTENVSSALKTRNEYLNTKIISYLSNLSNSEYGLTIEGKNGNIVAKNVASAVNITTENANIDIDYIAVKGASIIESNRLVKVKAPVADFILKTVRSKNSNANYKIKFGSINYSSYPKNSGDRILLTTEENSSVATILVNNASASQTDSITITSQTGGIEAVERV